VAWKSDEKGNGCCKDERKFIKITTDQKIAERLPISTVGSVTPLILF
jgi:hypothetical protein